MDTKEKRAQKLTALCDDLQSLNASMLKCLHPKESPRPESKAMPKPPLATTTPDVKADRVNKEIEVEMGDKMEVDQGAASPAKVVEAAAPSF